jgi:hypothetical protein
MGGGGALGGALVVIPAPPQTPPHALIADDGANGAVVAMLAHVAAPGCRCCHGGTCRHIDACA